MHRHPCVLLKSDIRSYANYLITDGKSMTDKHHTECSNTTTTLRNIADVAAIATCTTFTGTITVATDVAPVAELIGVETVIGSVIVANNSGIDTVSSPSIQTVTGDVILDTLPLLANISLPMWSSVNTLILNKIPMPLALDMQTTVQQVSNLYITDTTLETLFGLLLQTAQMETLQITGNQYLQDCWFGVGNITQQATILNNSGQMMLTLPNLTYAYNLDISNASSISIPLLESVSQNLDITWNEIQNLSLPHLSYVGQNFSVSQNSLLNELSVPELVNVQNGLYIIDNAQLDSVTGLSALSYVGGDLTIQGAFRNATLAGLGTVKGNAMLDSSDTFECSGVPSSIVKGSYNCNGETNAPGHSSSSNSGTKLTTGVIAGISVAAAVVVAGFVVGAAILWRRSTRSHGVRELDSNMAPPPPPKPNRSSSGYRDLKSTETIKEWQHGDVQPDYVAMDELDKKGGARQSVAEEVPREELPGSHPDPIYELPTSPQGPAHELPTPVDTEER